MPMEVANCRVTLNKYGSDVPLTHITPAQAIVLHTLHGPLNGGRTFGDEFSKIQVVGTAMVDTGKTERKLKLLAQPAKTHQEIISAQVSEPGKPDFKAQVVQTVVDTPAQDAIYEDVPILAERTPSQELARLRKVYGQAKNSKGELIIDKIWADKLNPKMPLTFKEINWQEVGDLATSPELQPAQLNYVTGALSRTS